MFYNNPNTLYGSRRAFMGIARPEEPDPDLAPLEALAQQVQGRSEDDFHWEVTALARKLWGELRDIYLLAGHEGDAQGWFTSVLYIRRNLRGPLEAAGLIEFRSIPDSRIEHLIRITPAGSALLGEPHPISQETLMLEAIQITPGCVPGIDYPPVEQEIQYEYLHCPSDEERLRPKPESYYLYLAKLRASALPNSAMETDTQPLDLPSVRPAKPDPSAFFRLLDEEMANAFMSLEQDRMVIARGHRDAIETIKRYVVFMQEQNGFLEYQVERHKEFEGWWKTQAERNLALADRHAAHIVKMSETPIPAQRGGAGGGEPRLSLVEVETLGDLAKKHAGGTLEGLLESLHLPVLDEFRSSYPVMHEAKAAIGKRIVDYSYAAVAYHVSTQRSRGSKLYLTLDYGFGTVNVFDRAIKEHFVKYPGGYDHWLVEGFEQELDPPVQLIMTRDAKSYARIDSLFVIE